MLTYFLFLLGFVLLIKGADFLVDGASAIARRFNISDLVIGLTVVAFGTSTPELFVNIVASARGNTDIAIGNVVGSNISNVFLILGISAIIYPLSVSKGTVWKEIPFSLLAAIVLGLMANDEEFGAVGPAESVQQGGRMSTPPDHLVDHAAFTEVEFLWLLIDAVGIEQVDIGHVRQ